MDIQCVVRSRAGLGEGACWDSRVQCLWWLDILGQAIHRYEPAGGLTRTFATPQRPGCLGVRATGGLIVAMGKAFHLFDPSTADFQCVTTVDADPELRMNDGKVDRQGRFWSGMMFEAQSKSARAVASLYRLDANRTCHEVLQGFVCSNGLAWSPDSRTIYFTDSSTPYVWAYDFDKDTGQVEHRRTFIDLSSQQAICDGATVDAEGCYWLTLPFKGKVQRYDPDGKLMRSIELPTDTPTCCEFGGPNLDTLYVTTATLNRSAVELEKQPWAGALLAMDVGVKGLPGCEYSG
jgi:L-arabinonolactonase